MRSALLILTLLAASPATAQVVYPGQPYIGDPIADQHRYRMDQLQSRSAEQAAFAQQYRIDARLTQMEIQVQRQPEPYIPRELRLLGSPEAEAEARAQATARRETVVRGVTQIDDWLARGPR